MGNAVVFLNNRDLQRKNGEMRSKGHWMRLPPPPFLRGSAQEAVCRPLLPSPLRSQRFFAQTDSIFYASLFFAHSTNGLASTISLDKTVMNCYVLGANFEQGTSEMITDSPPKTTCSLCGKRSILISEGLGVCLDCIREAPGEALALTNKAHERSRHAFHLPAFPPKDGEARCLFCANECGIPEGERGYCGLRENHGGKLRHLAGTRAKGLVSWYHDPLSTNCVADWVCPGGSETGYPEFSYCTGPEYGYNNLAVFYQACSFDCLFCQNWHFRQTNPRGRGHSASELAQAVDPRTSCICFFGGDPSPQMAHALAASRIALDKNGGRVLRICWETNGSASRPLESPTIALGRTSPIWPA
jgi:hypothetical protein